MVSTAKFVYTGSRISFIQYFQLLGVTDFTFTHITRYESEKIILFFFLVVASGEVYILTNSITSPTVHFVSTVDYWVTGFTTLPGKSVLSEVARAFESSFMSCIFRLL